MDVLDFSDAAGWESWLAENHDTQAEAWLRIGKLHADATLITIAEAGELALCFGWIDGQRKACDENSFLQRYSPRRSRSPWSKVNVARVESLIVNRRMRPPGLKEVDDAKADGRWEAAYESQRTASVPEDLRSALAGRPIAQAAFECLNRSEQYALILPILKAYVPSARATAIARVVTHLSVTTEA